MICDSTQNVKRILFLFSNIFLFRVDRSSQPHFRHFLQLSPLKNKYFFHGVFAFFQKCVIIQSNKSEQYL